MLLYKYLSPDRIDVIKGSRIRFTQPAEFNDPFEFKPVITTLTSKEIMDIAFTNQLSDSVDKFLTQNPTLSGERGVIEAYLTQFCEPLLPVVAESAVVGVAEKFNNDINESVGVLSLTESHSNLLMWAHYASEHTGFCIGFDSDSPFFNRKRHKSDELYHLRKVDYCIERPQTALSELTGVELLTTKSKDWIYEDEWRICALLQDSDYQIESTPNTIHLYDFPPESVKEIILGVSMSDTEKEKFKSAIKSNYKYKDVVIKEAFVSPTLFALEFVTCR